MKVPCNRAGGRLVPAKDPAWMSHCKEKNGYIIRVVTDQGYKLYRPELICNTTNWYYMFNARCPHGGGGHWAAHGHVPDKAHRRIQLSDDYYNMYSHRYYYPSYTIKKRPGQKSKAKPRKNCPISYAPSGMPIWKLKAREDKPEQAAAPQAVHLTDDPVEDGRDLAASNVPLPSDRWQAPMVRGVSTASRTADEREIDELYQAGILFDDQGQAASFGLKSIEHEEPAYTVRIVPRKKQKGKKATPHLAPSAEPDVGVVEDCDCWSQLLEAEEWELCPLDDDMLSIAESWIVMEEIEEETSAV